MNNASKKEYIKSHGIISKEEEEDKVAESQRKVVPMFGSTLERSINFKFDSDKNAQIMVDDSHVLSFDDIDGIKSAHSDSD